MKKLGTAALALTLAGAMTIPAFAAEDLPLGAADRSALAALGELLQGDEESICKGISLTSHRLAKSLEEARDSRAEREKRAGALWLSGAALLVILLI